jgi:small-conductance mechanosensitive channel
VLREDGGGVQVNSFFDALHAAGADALRSVGDVAARTPRFLAALVVVLLFVQLARLAAWSIARAERFSPRRQTNLELLGRQLIVVAVIVFGVAVGFGVLGLSLTTIAASFGVVGIVVGFALKDMLENFVAGIIILWQRPFAIHDQIRIGVNAGTVCEVNFRTTTLLTEDGIEVLIPNAQIFNQAVYNLTVSGSRRTEVVVTLPEGTDLQRARAVLEAALDGVPGVLHLPAPEVLVLGWAGQSDELHVRYWTAPGSEAVATVESSVRAVLRAALREAGIGGSTVTTTATAAAPAAPAQTGVAGDGTE